jgi:predicted nucleic acid-binding protein
MADRAASIRARYRLRTPDAIHLATAILEGVDVFLTNDRDLLQVREVPILLIDELR